VFLRPIAFRIWDYKSIADSGICTLSGDNITILAGQNEAGKTSILTALRDFNSEIGSAAPTRDIVPDHAPDAEPKVEVLMWVDVDKMLTIVEKKDFALPDALILALRQNPEIWIARFPLDGQMSFEPRIDDIWPSADEEENEPASTEEPSSGENTKPEAAYDEFRILCWENWPVFIYFDSFDDILPREIGIDLVAVPTAAQVPGQPAPPTKWKNPKLPQSVNDFLKLSGINLTKVRQLAEEHNEKQLKNYLNSRSAGITGDFLGYWKQRTGSEETVTLRAEHSRNEDQLFLNFYAFDGKTLQHPDQRSKGFSWFLSFYLRLAASVQREKDRASQVILIDEPGSFLHQKAQQDILDVLEGRIAPTDQVIFSSHSPYMMPPGKLHRVRIVTKGQSGAAFIADRLTDERIQRDEKGDALSPIMAAIGLDIGAASSVMHEENFVVEGITDYYYLHAWNKLLGLTTFDNRGIIPAKGTKNVPHLVSLCLARSRKFAILLDRDNAGDAAKEELMKEMDISPKVIVQPHDATCIEDLFSPQDFRLLLSKFDDRYKLDTGMSPSKAIKRQSIDKVLLARKFAELIADGTIRPDSLTQKTKDSAASLLQALEAAIKLDAVFRV
jgi:predicted ATP-dependent endonuclease of OLD family